MMSGKILVPQENDRTTPFGGAIVASVMLKRANLPILPPLKRANLQMVINLGDDILVII